MKCVIFSQFYPKNSDIYEFTKIDVKRRHDNLLNCDFQAGWPLRNRTCSNSYPLWMLKYWLKPAIGRQDTLTAFRPYQLK